MQSRVSPIDPCDAIRRILIADESFTRPKLFNTLQFSHATVVSLEWRESLPHISSCKLLTVFDVLEENEVRDAGDRFTVEELLFSEGFYKRLHVLQAQGHHSLLIINYEHHLKEVNELVVCDALKLVPAASLLGRGAEDLRTKLLRDVLVNSNCLSYFKVTVNKVRKICKRHKSWLSLLPLLLSEWILLVFPDDPRVAEQVSGWIASAHTPHIPVAQH